MSTEATKNIRISILIWLRLIRSLKIRGNGIRESGAFLLSKQGSIKVSEYICYDDLDPRCLDSGIIQFDGSGYIPLWDYCEQRSLKVIADVHSHPDTWTGQSGLDKTHPMIVTRGHIALIVPRYAQNRFQLMQGVGVHEYLGGHMWKEWEGKSNKIRITLL